MSSSMTGQRLNTTAPFEKSQSYNNKSNQLKNIKSNRGKEKHKMKMKNVYIITVLMTMVAMLGPAALVWAGAEGGALP